jgi:hypothetical protein
MVSTSKKAHHIFFTKISDVTLSEIIANEGQTCHINKLLGDSFVLSNANEGVTDAVSTAGAE